MNKSGRSDSLSGEGIRARTRCRATGVKALSFEEDEVARSSFAEALDA